MRVALLVCTALALLVLGAGPASAAKRSHSLATKVGVPPPGEITLKAIVIQGKLRKGAKFPRRIGVKVKNRKKLGSDVRVLGRVSRYRKSRNKLLLVLATERPVGTGTGARAAQGSGGATDAQIAVNIPTFIALRVAVQKQFDEVISHPTLSTFKLIGDLCDQAEERRHHAALLFGTPFGQGTVEDLYDLAILEACDDFDDDFPPRNFLLNFLMFGARSPITNMQVGILPSDPTDLIWHLAPAFPVQGIYITTERPIANPGFAVDETTGRTVPGSPTAVAGRVRDAAGGFTFKPKYVVRYDGLNAAAGDSISVRLQDSPASGDVARAELVTPDGRSAVGTLKVP